MTEQPHRNVDLAGLTRMDGRGVVVLGVGGEGMGTATARLLAAAGAKVMCVDIREDLARAVAEEIGGEPHVADVTDRRAMEALFARADALFGDRFSGVVDIVGQATGGNLASFDDGTIERLFAGNLRHALLTVQIAGPMLAARGGGSMVFVGSLAGAAVSPGQAIYAVAKAGLHHLVRHAADEYGPRGVRANVVAPGIILTAGVRAVAPPAALEKIAGDTPLRRVGQPQDVANTIYFLTSDLSAYVTGSVIYVDGGTMTGANLPRMGAPEP